MTSTLGFIVLMTSLSICGDKICSGDHVLFNLSIRNGTPGFLAHIDHHNIPVGSLVLSKTVASLIILVGCLLPRGTFNLLVTLIMTALLLG